MAFFDTRSSGEPVIHRFSQTGWSGRLWDLLVSVLPCQHWGYRHLSTLAFSVVAGDLDLSIAAHYPETSPQECMDGDCQSGWIKARDHIYMKVNRGEPW